MDSYNKESLLAAYYMSDTVLEASDVLIVSPHNNPVQWALLFSYFKGEETEREVKWLFQGEEDRPWTPEPWGLTHGVYCQI